MHSQRPAEIASTCYSGYYADVIVSQEETPKGAVSIGRRAAYGGKCSVEFLSNVKCYILTLIQRDSDTSQSTSRCCIPNRNGVSLEFSLQRSNNNSKDHSSSSDVSYCEVMMYHRKTMSNDPLLLFRYLPVDGFSLRMDQKRAPNFRFTTDDDSLSARI